MLRWQRSGYIQDIRKLRHQSLIAWQRADDLFIRLHELARTFPASERFELGGQLRRAGYSVPANIVEGFARRSMKARVHFLNVAEASLAEAEYCVHVAWRLGYITAQQRDELDALIGAVNAPLVGLIRSTRAALSSTVAVVPLAVIAVGYLANAL